MYIKLIRYEYYDISDFFDKSDSHIKKIKYVNFKGNNEKTKINVINNTIYIDNLWVDCYDLFFFDINESKYESKYTRAFIMFNPKSKLDCINSNDSKNLGNLHKIIYNNINNTTLLTFDIDDLLCKRMIYDLLKKTYYTTNIVEFVRNVAKIVNYDDDYGIIFANWKNNSNIIKDTSLKTILNKYIYRTDINEYGQCFTFAAVLCGILRHFNIPSRTVTCMNAFHDGDQDGNIKQTQQDVFVKFAQSPQTNKDDFLWNFHVWTECFLNGEWYSIDSSPVYTNIVGECVIGPSKVKYIKENIYLNDDYNYDTIIFGNTVGNNSNNYNLNKYIKLYTCQNNKIIDLTNTYKSYQK